LKESLLETICCPHCKNLLNLREKVFENSEVKEGTLVCQCKKEYQITNYIPRFVKGDNYANSFTFEWQKHRRTQLDLANFSKRSEEAFKNRVDFDLGDLSGKLVLDAGCGCGRFAEVVANYGGTVVGFDLSYAIDVAFENIGLKENVHLVQTDIFNLPFKVDGFDFAYSFGVLHHTPDAHKAFKQLIPLLRRGGKISIFVYSSYNKGIVYTSNFWRFFTTRMSKRLLYYFCFISVPLYYLYRLPIIGNMAKMLFVISMEPNWKWRVLDTFDWYSPKFQSKHTHAEVFKWFNEAELSEIAIFEGEISISGTKI